MLDFREHWHDGNEAMRVALESHQAHMWTALPGIIQSYNAQAMTVQVQPAIQGTVQDEQGNITSPNLPVLPDVPVVFPRGGQYTMTFPINQGDECLVVFASRNIDNWWQQGGIQAPFDIRKHDLSDGFALVGPFSQKQKISNVSTTTVQLRSADGVNYIELDVPNQRGNWVLGRTTIQLDNKQGSVSVTAANSIALNAPIVTVNGQVMATGNVTAFTSSGPVDMQHRHVFTDSHGDSGTTLPPLPGT